MGVVGTVAGVGPGQTFLGVQAQPARSEPTVDENRDEECLAFLRGVERKAFLGCIEEIRIQELKSKITIFKGHFDRIPCQAIRNLEILHAMAFLRILRPIFTPFLISIGNPQGSCLEFLRLLLMIADGETLDQFNMLHAFGISDELLAKPPRDFQAVVLQAVEKFLKYLNNHHPDEFNDCKLLDKELNCKVQLAVAAEWARLELKSAAASSRKHKRAISERFPTQEQPTRMDNSTRRDRQRPTFMSLEPEETVAEEKTNSNSAGGIVGGSVGQSDPISADSDRQALAPNIPVGGSMNYPARDPSTETQAPKRIGLNSSGGKPQRIHDYSEFSDFTEETTNLNPTVPTNQFEANPDRSRREISTLEEHPEMIRDPKQEPANSQPKT